MKIAIVGTGIAGNVVAHHLAREHDITVYEAGAHVGGHTHTHDVQLGGRSYQVDTGFIVYNDWTYPNFIALLDELGVATQPSSMSFSVRDERSGLEYNGTTLNTLFAQRRNLLRPSFLRMIRDILRFNREAPALLQDGAEDITLGDYLERGRYTRGFIEHYVVPMGAAIWSTDPVNMLAFPARYFVRFFHNHGMLSVNERPQWRVIRGGSARYVEALAAPFRDRIRLNTPVQSIRREGNHAWVQAQGQAAERYDAVFLACHSDQALRLLADPSAAESEVLGAIRYQPNEAVLHTDARLLPRTRRAWAAWNYHVLPQDTGRVALTYNMNILQSLDAPTPLLVTLNHSDAIDPAKVIKRIPYEHPLYTRAGVAAQARHGQINGPLNTYYCGAYWRYGFHEDGVVSALTALEHFKARAHV
ncbi:NADH-ubiquinone oxidoreductase subunit 6 [Hylemonella gracilis str. Niagara R]|uniref:NADH-ubiquinone oxidoreductase subunit 6 n=1 Tax=Hylemonella gracilis str. Niagara R TaxID=1458275 RepID=A0A016XGG7_9BURK|nr:FAD-dependent oxidoreductase [Hylemonella gracilis]EYC50936.1 NADH-ubiquinone oxidoreductase subunit 6 [Hylemonella gracilis str. Niagara R]